MTDRSCYTCLHLAVAEGSEPCESCIMPGYTKWQPKGQYTQPIPGITKADPVPANAFVRHDFETHPAGTARRIAQLEQEVAAQQRRLVDMAVEMQKFMGEAQQRR